MLHFVPKDSAAGVTAMMLFGTSEKNGLSSSYWLFHDGCRNGSRWPFPGAMQMRVQA
jgi:hypothetical protein